MRGLGVGDQVRARAERVIEEHGRRYGATPPDGMCSFGCRDWPCLVYQLARDVLGLLSDVTYERERNQTNVLAYSEHVKELGRIIALQSEEASLVRGENARLREALQEWLALAEHKALSTTNHRRRTRALLGIEPR